MALHTINAKQLDAGSIIVLPNGTRRAVAAVDDTATHVYLDFADGGCGIYELDALVTVERAEVPFRTEHALCGKCGRHIMRCFAHDGWSDLGDHRPAEYTNVCVAGAGGHVPAYGIVWH